MKVIEHGSGLHFLLRFDPSIPDDVLQKKFMAEKIYMKPLVDYYEGAPLHCRHTFILNYSGVCDEKLEEAVASISRVLMH